MYSTLKILKEKTFLPIEESMSIFTLLGAAFKSEVFSFRQLLLQIIRRHQ